MMILHWLSALAMRDIELPEVEVACSLGLLEVAREGDMGIGRHQVKGLVWYVWSGGSLIRNWAE